MFTALQTVVNDLSCRKNGVFPNGDHPGQPAIIKPQVVRPQPVYGFPTGSGFNSTGNTGVPIITNGVSAGSSNANFNSFPQPFRDIETR